MTTRFHTLLGVFALAAAFSAFGATACWAQIGGPGITGNGVGPVVNPSVADERARKEAAPAELPPAVPGAKSDPAQVAPASKLPTAMNPTDALFDAINRGDIVVARDAISRGADLDGHNVLGMTPMELAVDLSRNDITFMLLSLRGGDSGSRGPPPPPTKTAKGGSQKAIREARANAAALPRVATPAPPRVAKLFSGDGGAPAPQSGFLGFSGSATTTASSGN